MRVPGERLVKAIQEGAYPWWFPLGAVGLSYDYFVYGTDFAPLAASATTTNAINIEGDSAFIVLCATMVETATDNTTFLAQRPLLVQLSSGGSGRYLQNTPIHADNYFGTAEEPKYWDVPKVLVPNSTFNVQLQNLEATARNVRLAFHGFKIFGFRP